MNNPLLTVACDLLLSSALVSTAGAQTYQWSTFAGTPGSAGSANGTGSAARFSNPSGVAVDSSGNVYVADLSNHTIRKITPASVGTRGHHLGRCGNGYGSAGARKTKRQFFHISSQSSGGCCRIESTVKVITGRNLICIYHGHENLR